MSKIPGKLMGIAVGYNFIACETECSLAFDSDMLAKDSTISGKWSEYIMGKRRWTMSVNGMLLKREAGADFKTLYRAFVNGDLLTIVLRTRDGVDQYLIWQGQAFVNSGSLTASNRGTAAWTITFQGNGPLNFDWEEFFTIINAMPAPVDQPNTVDTREWD